MPSFIALLRGVNVGGRNPIPMAELRALGSELGWANVQTYIQSGNVVFRTAGPTATLEGELERAIEGRSGLSVPVIVRAGTDR